MTPRVVAHRGASRHAPENTLGAMRRALDLGADWIEIDVRLTRDGVPVVLHDATVDRTTDGHGPVSAHTLARLRQLNAGGWFGPEFALERIPTLEEVLTFTARAGMGAMVELKEPANQPALVARAVAVIQQVTADHPALECLVESFEWSSLEQVRKWAPALPLAALVGGYPPWNRWPAVEAVTLPWAAVLLQPGLIAAARGQGKDVYAYTVNRPTVLRRLENLGVRGVVTDAPGVARRVLAQ